MSVDSDQLRTEELRGRLTAPNGRYAAVNVIAGTGSTNSDLVEAAKAGAADRTVLIADRQTAGRGRQQRGWASPPGAGLYLSVLLRPTEVPVARLGWLPLLAGVALVRVVTRVARVEAALKWPNDLLAGRSRGKAAGILAEMAGGGEPAAVVGIGLNVHAAPEQLPTGPGGIRPTSLAAESAVGLDRTVLAAELLEELAEVDARWRAAAGDPVASGLLEEYRRSCATLDQPVRVELPANGDLTGTAVDVDADGRLIVRTAEGEDRPVSAGDVVHVRPS